MTRLFRSPIFNSVVSNASNWRQAKSAQVTVTIPFAMLEVIGEDGISRREPGTIHFLCRGAAT